MADFTTAFTVESLAAYWCCSADVIYDLLRQKKLKGFKIGTSWRISPREVAAFEDNSN